ncbi:MAG: NADH-quinone oxidoreductase subunit L [Emcibacteraceae bacterium]|nr:NADH-quinone oxidoreductase subunit L [Emcibacteraceae bacterium]
MYQTIVFLPLIASIIAGLFGNRIGVRGAQVVTCGALIISAVLSWVAFFQVAMAPGDHSTHVQVLSWIVSGDFNVNWAFQIDTLTAVMLVVVNTVSCLVHIYSVGYMSHDPHIQRFMSYLSLFTFAMLMLITSDNFVQMFFGWEGVGLASYLLIGFWYKKPTACAAAIKAFVVNRVGDFGFALGIFAIFMTFGSADFAVVFANVGDYADKSIHFLGMEADLLTTICLLLFIGAMGKSAQLGLHTWLPDAMEGPTPVSALIHAATMVTAGVFMVARCSPLFEYAPAAMDVVAIIGASTAFFAATVGMSQFDIKRVIAYSTCSQLGYMFFALGVGAYGAAIFHLFTHAFFKALLFLGSGSVIHASSDEQDMRNMGGLRKKIPMTFWMMTIGTLALTGFPFFAGYYSKDMIIESAFAAHSGVGTYAFGLGVAAAFMTAFYSWRLVFMTFFGESRASKEVQDHVHESPQVMLVPLYVLALGALFSGFLFKDYFVGVNYEEFWAGALFLLGDNVMEAAHHVPTWVIASPFIAMVTGLALAWYFYIKEPSMPAKFTETFRFAHAISFNKWYFDELYDIIFVKPCMKLGMIFWKRGDENIIDRYGPDGVSAAVVRIAERFKQLQSGYVYHYAFAMLIGLSAFVTYFVMGAQ